MNWFALARVLYEARIREAWNFGPGHSDGILAKRPFPRHPADADVRSQSAEVDLAIAQAKALLKTHKVEPL